MKSVISFCILYTGIQYSDGKCSGMDSRLIRSFFIQTQMICSDMVYFDRS